MQCNLSFMHIRHKQPTHGWVIEPAWPLEGSINQANLTRHSVIDWTPFRRQNCLHLGWLIRLNSTENRRLGIFVKNLYNSFVDRFHVCNFILHEVFWSILHLLIMPFIWKWRIRLTQCHTHCFCELVWRSGLVKMICWSSNQQSESGRKVI